MIIPSFLACPRCNSGSLLYEVGRIICNGCERTYPTIFGIVDFRDAEIDKTAAFSIVDDRRLAEQLSIIFNKVPTFNALCDTYKVLKQNVGTVVSSEEINIEELFANQVINTGSLSEVQLGHGRAILEKLSEYISTAPHGMPPNNMALENGCGLGFFIDGFAAHFKKLVVLDFSLCYLVLAKKIIEERNLANVTLICGSVENLPFKNETFDFIHSNNVIEHVSDQKALFIEAKRVLKTRGLFFVLSPNRFSSYFEPHFRLPFYGFIPKFIRRIIIQIWQRRSIDDISLLSLSELRKLVASQFGENFIISFIPRYLNKTITGGFIRNILVGSLNSRILGPATNILVNRILLGLMPYHVVLCFKI
jgi:ubiquinone/menaquinone biosynthesis C-methylase UbiE